MREVTISTYCDRCIDKGEREPATTAYTVGVVEGTKARPQLRVIELCEAHGKDVAELAAFAKARGVSPDSADQPTARQGSDPAHSRSPACPACGEDRSTPANLAAHVYRDHLHVDLPSPPTSCPECGNAFDTARSCGVHRRLMHNTSTATDAIAALTGTGTRRRKAAAK